MTDKPAPITGFMHHAASMVYRRRRAFAITAFLFLSILGSNAFYRGVISVKPRTDLPVFLRGAQAVIENQNIYDVKTKRQWNYVYLPLLATLLVPFVHAPMSVTVILWYLLSAGAYWATFWLLRRLAEDEPSGFEAALTAFVLSFPSYLTTLTRGQLGALTMFLAAAVYYLYRNGRSFWAGAVLAFAVVLKTTPLAPLVFFFAAKRDWKACLGFAAGTAVFLFLIPSLIMGFDRNLDMLQEYRRVISISVSEQGRGGLLWEQLVTPFASDNQSIYAAVTRLRWPSEADFMANSDTGIRWAVRLAGALALGILVLVSAKSRREKGSRGDLAEYSLFATILLLVSPVSELHHFTVLMLPIFAAVRIIQDPRQHESSPLLWTAVLAGAFSYLLGLCSRRLGYWGVPAWGSLFFWLLLFFAAVRIPQMKFPTLSRSE